MADVLKINLIVPSYWTALSNKQMRFLYKLIADERPSVEIKTRCLLRWGGLSVVCRKKDGKYIVRHGKQLFDLSAMDVTEAISVLDWIEEPVPTVPVRPSCLCGRTPLPADFQEVPLKTFIIADNLYQGWLFSRSDELCSELFHVLYPDRRLLYAFCRSNSSVVETAVFYWFAALKNMFSRKWPELFKSATPQTESNMLGYAPANLESNMNTLIRALTKGDITKEQEVLEMDTWRALEELNAQAREYNEFNRKYGK